MLDAAEWIDRSNRIYEMAERVLAEGIRRELPQELSPDQERRVAETARRWAYLLADIDSEQPSATRELDRSSRFLRWLDEQRKNVSADTYLQLRSWGGLSVEQQELYGEFLLEVGGADELKGAPRPSLAAIKKAIKTLRQLDALCYLGYR